MGEHHKKEKMDYECDYCKKEFKTLEEVEEHESKCQKKPVRIRGNIKIRSDVWEGFKFGIGFILAMIFIGILAFIIITIVGFSIIKSIF